MKYKQLKKKKRINLQGVSEMKRVFLEKIIKTLKN